MSRYFTEKYRDLAPYVPGEQPKATRYIKLNTNESPFPPSPLARQFAREEAEKLHLYSDPTCADLTAAAAEALGLAPEELLFTNGSDEILNFAFAAFCDGDHPAVFPDITYGFYPVFAAFNRVPFETVPLKEDFTIDPEDYIGLNKTIFIANPNAPTGLALPLSDIERIAAGNPEGVVVIDEAYVDFGGQSALPLIRRYPNLLVTRTFSKSRSLAGARLGFGAGDKELIADLNRIKYATNPYNVNRMTMGAGIGALKDTTYFEKNIESVRRTREKTAAALKELGFAVTDSKANFLFARSDRMGGGELYRKLKDRGVLVRHFDLPPITDWLRITVGSEEEMTVLIERIKDILEGSR